MSTFEILADRLAHAATAAERMAAAEQLAALTDPRVAPALARALADADDGVRARADELLAQFCHRDQDSSLRLLLDEAERMADALSTEVRRLRGDSAGEPEAAQAHPLPPPEGYEGECALVRLAPRRQDLKRASTIVAKATQTARFLITREMQTTKGFLARAVPAGIARTVIDELAAAGIIAGAIPTADVPEPTPPVRLRDPVFDAAALHGTALPDGHACELPWDSVKLALAARIEVELRRDSRDEDWSLFTRPIRPSHGSAHELAYEYVLEVFAGEPLARYRLATHELDFDAMQRRPSSFPRAARLARQLVPHVPRGRINAGLRRMEEQDQDDWNDLTFVSPPGFESYVAWQLLLLRLGLSLPR